MPYEDLIYRDDLRFSPDEIAPYYNPELRPMTDPALTQGVPMGPAARGLTTKLSNADPQTLLRAGYLSFLGGREPGPGELDLHARTPGGVGSALQHIYDSPEARNYRSTNPARASAVTAGPFMDSLVTPPSATTTAANGPRGWNNLLLTPRTGGNSGMWAGFNNDRALAGGDPNSTKDAWFRFGQGFNFDPRGKSKEEIEAFIRTQLPAAKEYGLDIADVKGDQILVRTKESGDTYVWVDVVGNAGGTGDSPWQWIDQSTLGTPGVPASSLTTERAVATTNQLFSNVTHNQDGTVTLRVTPEAYRELAAAKAPLSYADLAAGR